MVAVGEADSMLAELLSGGVGKNEANDRLIVKTLMFLEPLDKACCRNHPKCVWSRDESSFYRLLRTNSDMPPGWPGPHSNDDDFDADAPPTNSEEYHSSYYRVPPSRLSQCMVEAARGGEVALT